MNRDEQRTLLCDYLDGLLGGAERDAAEDWIARHPDTLAEVARFRAALYHPYAVAPPASDQVEAIWRRHGDRPAWRWMRYAAVFAAGVLTTLLVQSGAQPPSAPGAAPLEHSAPPVAEAAAPALNRRIR